MNRQPAWATACTNYLYDADSQIDGTTSYGGGGDQTEGTNYDANGNPTGSGVVIGAGNRLLSDGIYNYGYDTNGNMVSQTNIATGAATSFAFDPMNRLLGVVATNSSHQITLSVAYSYDLQGDLLSRTAKYYNNGTLTNTNVSDFVFDPVSGNVVLAFNGSGALTDRYLYGPAVDELLADERVSSLSSAGTNLWTAIDNEGSVRDVWEDGVGLIDHIVYNSFGAITSQTNSNDAPLIGYTGSFTDPDTGLQWHNDPTGKQIGRWYDPKTQQWIGPDPDGLGPDSNPYRYVGNNPTNGTDPSGLSWLGNDYTWYPTSLSSLNPLNSIFVRTAMQLEGEAMSIALTGSTVPIANADDVSRAYFAGEASGAKSVVTAPYRLGYMAGQRAHVTYNNAKANGQSDLSAATTATGVGAASMTGVYDFDAGCHMSDALTGQKYSRGESNLLILSGGTQVATTALGITAVGGNIFVRISGGRLAPASVPVEGDADFMGPPVDGVGPAEPSVPTEKPGQPPLQRIHPDSTYTADPEAKASLEYWRTRPTEEIVESLKPGGKDPLITKPDGRMYQGNTRTKVLEERGYDINSLPRDVLPPDPSFGD